MLLTEFFPGGIFRMQKILQINNVSRATALTIFERYKENHTIQQGLYSEPTWILTDELRSVRFHFDIPTDQWVAGEWLSCSLETYTDSMKQFALFSLGRIALPTIRNGLHALTRLASTSSNEIQADPADAGMILDFLQVLPGESYEKDAVMENLECTSWRLSDKRRELASFEVYVKFHEQFSNFYASQTDDGRRHFFPIWLWWTVTMILPSRASEFILIPKNCLDLTEPDRPLLTVRKTRLKKGKRRVFYKLDMDFELCTYPVTSSIAHEIQWYTEVTHNSRNSDMDTLFVPEGRARYLTYSAIRTLLQECLDALGMDGIRLGDTRHLAMISLVMSGNSPEICRVLAHHTNIVVSSHYYTNMHTLLNSAMVYLIRSTGQIPCMTNNFNICLSIPSTFSRVQDGYCDIQDIHSHIREGCLSHWIPGHHIGDCSVCPHYYPDNPGMYMDMKEDAHKTLHSEFDFLLDLIQQFRNQQGKTEDLSAALARFQASMQRYAHFSRIIP